jgi:hypothetical protein
MGFGVVYYADSDAKESVVEDMKDVNPLKKGLRVPFDSLPATFPAAMDTPTKGKPERQRDTHGRFVAANKSRHELLLSNTEILHNPTPAIFDEASDTSYTSLVYEENPGSVTSEDWDKISQYSFEGEITPARGKSFRPVSQKNVSELIPAISRKRTLAPSQEEIQDMEPPGTTPASSSWSSSSSSSSSSSMTARNTNHNAASLNLSERAMAYVEVERLAKTDAAANLSSSNNVSPASSASKCLLTSSTRLTRSLSERQASTQLDVKTPQSGVKRHTSRTKKAMTTNEVEHTRLVDAFKGCHIPFSPPARKPEISHSSEASSRKSNPPRNENRKSVRSRRGLTGMQKEKKPATSGLHIKRPRGLVSSIPSQKMGASSMGK